MLIKKVNSQGALELVSAMVLISAIDIINCEKKLKKSKLNASEQRMLEEAKAFLKSDMLKIISDIDGEYIINELYKTGFDIKIRRHV